MRSDRELIVLYEQWSEGTHAAGFLQPSPGTIREFRRWLSRETVEKRPLFDYEQEFLDEYHKQEAEEK